MWRPFQGLLVIALGEHFRTPHSMNGVSRPWSFPSAPLCPSFRGCRQGAIVKEDKVVLIDDLVATGARAWVRRIRCFGNLEVSLNRSISQSCSNMSQPSITNTVM